MLFQLTRSRGAWLCFFWWCSSNQKFQLTRSRGAWLFRWVLNRPLFDISTHTLTWSVTNSVGIPISSYLISTHTLTWSVTQFQLLAVTDLAISTHTLTWSVTVSAPPHAVSWIYFNSHAHVERDSIDSIVLDLISLISTHTLTWSVTCIIDKTIRFVKFQLTRSRGAWHCRYNSNRSILKFQLTRSRGAWLLTVRVLSISFDNFNSHAHVERDYDWLVNTPYGDISTHTLTWSVTCIDSNDWKRQYISTHTLTWSVTFLRNGKT